MTTIISLLVFVIVIVLLLWLIRLLPFVGELAIVKTILMIIVIVAAIIYLCHRFLGLA